MSKMIRQVLDRHRNRIGRVGDLRDEAAVLAERRGETLARPGRTALEHAARIRL